VVAGPPQKSPAPTAQKPTPAEPPASSRANNLPQILVFALLALLALGLILFFAFNRQSSVRQKNNDLHLGVGQLGRNVGSEIA
jgi:hypothetical protein